MNDFFNRENRAVTTPPTPPSQGGKKRRPPLRKGGKTAPPSQGGEKRRNEIGMKAQLVQDRLFIAPARDRACPRIGLNAEALRHIMSLRRGERTMARLFSRLRVRAACRFPPDPGARIHEHSRATG